MRSQSATMWSSSAAHFLCRASVPCAPLCPACPAGPSGAASAALLAVAGVLAKSGLSKASALSPLASPGVGSGAGVLRAEAGVSDSPFPAAAAISSPRPASPLLGEGSSALPGISSWPGPSLLLCCPGSLCPLLEGCLSSCMASAAVLTELEACPYLSCTVALPPPLGGCSACPFSPA